MEKLICPICKREIQETESVVRCSVCGIAMHKGCVDEEILSDAEGNILCPYDAALAALDWLDHIISVYTSAFTEEQKDEIISRMNSYIEMLKK